METLSCFAITAVAKGLVGWSLGGRGSMVFGTAMGPNGGGGVPTPGGSSFAVAGPLGSGIVAIAGPPEGGGNANIGAPGGADFMAGASGGAIGLPGGTVVSVGGTAMEEPGGAEAMATGGARPRARSPKVPGGPWLEVPGVLAPGGGTSVGAVAGGIPCGKGGEACPGRAPTKTWEVAGARAGGRSAGSV